jgi:transcriptional regulator with GAF, ATPase, and Fis domain
MPHCRPAARRRLDARPIIDSDDARDALLPSPAPQKTEDATLVPDARRMIDLKGIVDRVARHDLEEAMATTGGNKARTAKPLGFGNATTLTNWLKRHGIEPRWHGLCVT